MIGIKRLAEALTKKGLVKTGLQVAATAAGGPMAGKVVEAVAEAMGLPGESPDYLARIVETADPKDLAKLREIEANLEVARMEDTQHARETFRGANPLQWIIGLAVLCANFAIIGALIFVPIPAANSDIVNIFAGALLGSMNTVVAYFFGSSAGSARKTDMMNK